MVVDALQRLGRAGPVEVPCVVGGEEVFTGNVQQQVCVRRGGREGGREGGGETACNTKCYLSYLQTNTHKLA